MFVHFLRALEGFAWGNPSVVLRALAGGHWTIWGTIGEVVPAPVRVVDQPRL